MTEEKSTPNKGATSNDTRSKLTPRPNHWRSDFVEKQVAFSFCEGQVGRLSELGEFVMSGVASRSHRRGARWQAEGVDNLAGPRRDPEHKAFKRVVQSIWSGVQVFPMSPKVYSEHLLWGEPGPTPRTNRRVKPHDENSIGQPDNVGGNPGDLWKHSHETEHAIKEMAKD